MLTWLIKLFSFINSFQTNATRRRVLFLYTLFALRVRYRPNVSLIFVLVNTLGLNRQQLYLNFKCWQSKYIFLQKHNRSGNFINQNQKTCLETCSFINLCDMLYKTNEMSFCLLYYWRFSPSVVRVVPILPMDKCCQRQILILFFLLYY